MKLEEIKALSAEERAEIETRYLDRASIEWSHKVVNDVTRLLAAEQYERERADAAEKRAGRLAAALTALIARWDEVAPFLRSAEQLAWIHGARYDGPTLEKPLADVRAALAEEPKPDTPQEPQP